MVAALAATVVPAAVRHRGLDLAGAGVVALVVLVATQRYPAGSVALPVAGGAVGFAVTSGRRRDDAVRGERALAAVAVVVAWIYLSVPDTEGAVVLGGAVAGLLATWACVRRRARRRDVATGIGALLGAAAAVAWQGATAGWTPGGWIGAKVALLVVLLVVLLTPWRARRAAGSHEGLH